MAPFFSVIIPLYNKEGYIKSTLQSVLNQSFTDFEIIIINDGSTDSSTSEVKQFTDSRISFYQQENKGLSAARNAGIKKAKADYIALLDADDLWEAHYLESIKNLIKNYENHHIFASDFKPWPNEELPPLNIQNTISQGKVISDYFNLKRNIFCYSSVVFHKVVFDTIGYFDESVNYGEEEDFTIRALQKHELVHLSFAPVYYRTSVENQLTSTSGNSKRSVPDYTKYVKQNPKVTPYVNFIHFKLLLLYKMERNKEMVNYYSKKVNPRFLTFEQKLKYYLPTTIFHLVKRGYLFLKA